MPKTYTTLRQRSVNTSAKPVGYYVSGDELIDEMQECYGGQFEEMPQHLKLIFRAALANYLACRPYWEQSGSDVTCMQACIESAGVDAGIWVVTEHGRSDEEELVDFIEGCGELSDDRIEGLIEALTAQIRYTKEVR
jgi:hypothetical protein